MAIWRLCTSFHFVPTSIILVAMETNIHKSDNGAVSPVGDHIAWQSLVDSVLMLMNFENEVLSKIVYYMYLQCNFDSNALHCLKFPYTM